MPARNLGCWSVGASLGALALLFSSPALAVSPESPEVKAMVKKGLAYLEDKTDSRLGGKCLIGLAFYKDGQKDHKKVEEAMVACKSGSYEAADNYSLGIAIMFLCDVDPENNRSLMEKMIAVLLKKQKECGGWGYDANKTGDTSQTQYAVLGMWMASGNGVKIPIAAEENVANWLLRTQDPTGGWGYQGVDPGNYTHVNQSEVHGSLTSAGLGSLYIIADSLHLTTPKEAEQEGPKALKIIREGGAQRQPRTNRVDRNVILRGLHDGDRWYPEHLKLEEIKWFYYYIYAMERYQSFRELADGRFEKEPAWYNKYYKMLVEKQEADGGWGAQPAPEGKEIATAFSILFLLRSAKQAVVKVAKLGDGVLLGGMGLPPDVANLKEKDGKVVETELDGSIEKLLEVLESDSDPLLAAQMATENKHIELSSDVTKRAGEINRLRAMVSSPVYEARMVAVRSLGKAGSMDNVPLLIYALTDPDIRVVRESDKCLRFVSRKFDGFGFPADDKPGKTEIDKLRANWKKWYLSIRPDAELLD